LPVCPIFGLGGTCPSAAFGYTSYTVMSSAGCANCPYYARIEMLADQLSANLPDFQVRKIVRLQHEWEASCIVYSQNEQIVIYFDI